MIDADGTLRTNEMSLAAVLVIHGYAPYMELTDNNGEVIWIITASEMDEFAEDLVDEFQRGACRVEPKRFMREVRQVRQELYKFMGHRHDGARRSSPAA